MALKVMPVLIAVVILHQLGPMEFAYAVLLGVPLGTILGWCLVPMTRRLMRTRYAPIINLRLGEHPTDAGCGALVFIACALLFYNLFFVEVPRQRARREAKQQLKPRQPAR